MAKLYNPTYANRMFADAFVPTYLQNQKLAQQESEFSREMNFQNRQLQLGEAFRRDELKATIDYHNMLGNYYQNLDENADLDRELNIQQGIADLNARGFQEVPEGTTLQPDTSLQQIYGKNWVAPAVEQSRWVPGAFGTSIEQKYTTDPITGNENISNYETVITPPTNDNSSNSGGLGGADISNEVGELHKLVEFYDMNAGKFKAGDKLTYTDSEGNELEMDYKLLKANMTKYMTDMMSKAGVPLQGDLVSQIRSMAGITLSDDNATKRKKLLHTVDYARSQGVLDESQYEALRYWAEAGTR